MISPVLIRPVTASEVAATAAIRFREQYRDWSVDDKFASGDTKQDVDDIFNTRAHTPENVASALNIGWAYPQCQCCDGHFQTCVQLKRPWGNDDETFQVCASCLAIATSMLQGLDCTAAPSA